MRLPITISHLTVPLLLDARRSDQPHNNPQERLESVSFVLPSDLLCALHEAGPQALPGAIRFLGMRFDGKIKHPLIVDFFV